MMMISLVSFSIMWTLGCTKLDDKGHLPGQGWAPTVLAAESLTLLMPLMGDDRDKL